MDISDSDVKALALKANDIRVSIIEMLLLAGSGHTAGPLGIADVFTAVYFKALKHNPFKPDWEDRDRVVLSNGHICPVLYATLAHSGYFKLEVLKTLRKFGSQLQGHPHREFLKSVETSSGPLGSGLSQAVGMAIAERIDSGVQSPKTFYCFMGDGELDCGEVWEAAMLGGKEKLHNIIVIVDRNNIQIDGYTEDVMPLEPLKDKWKSFNWHVQEVDGHDFREILSAIERAKAILEKPSVIIARTIASKGVPQFERKFEWHGKAPNEEEAKLALEELKKAREEI
jgi:transketolase